MPRPESPPVDQILDRILTIRGARILLDDDLAAIYGVATKALNQAAKRNADRFPADFRFPLNREEVVSLRSQSVTSKNKGRGGRRKPPFAFTEHGALMAATVLNSPRAVQMSLVVIRAFVALRRVVLDQKALSEKLAELDAQVGIHDQQLAEIIEAIRQLAASPEPDHGRKIGFLSQDPSEI
jgi:hypothetical protein